MTIKRKTEQIAVPVYFNPTTFKAICKDAASMQFRGVLLLPEKAKEHGFEGEKVYQRKGIGKFLKHCWKYWQEHESERLIAVAQLKAKEKALLEEKKKLGVD